MELLPCSLGPTPHIPNPLSVVGPPRRKRSLILLGLYGCIIPPHRDSCSTCDGVVRREERGKRGREEGEGRKGGTEGERRERRGRREEKGMEKKGEREEARKVGGRRGMATNDTHREFSVDPMQSTDPVIDYLLVQFCLHFCLPKVHIPILALIKLYCISV